VTQAALTVVGILLAALGAWSLVVRRTAGTAGGAIHVVTSRYLGAKRFLTLVEVDGQRLLLGVAGDRVSLVARLGAERADEAEVRPER
jgi:flagellar biogenesis protein FliO